MCALYRWLDKLGLAASLGLGVVMRQVFVGAGSYHLVDDNLDPLPVRIYLRQHFDVCLMHAPPFHSVLFPSSSVIFMVNKCSKIITE